MPAIRLRAHSELRRTQAPAEARSAKAGKRGHDGEGPVLLAIGGEPRERTRGTPAICVEVIDKFAAPANTEDSGGARNQPGLLSPLIRPI